MYYVAQKVARFLGTNNIDNARAADALTLHRRDAADAGGGGEHVQLQDWWGTDLVIFFGSNPANDQPVAMKYLEQAKKLGTKVVLVNLHLEPGMRRYWVPSSVKSSLGTDIADWWFPVARRAGTSRSSTAY